MEFDLIYLFWVHAAEINMEFDSIYLFWVHAAEINMEFDSIYLFWVHAADYILQELEHLRFAHIMIFYFAFCIFNRYN